MNRVLLIGGLPFVNVVITYRGTLIKFKNVLIDTGSAGTIFKFDILNEIGLEIDDYDTVESIRGIGGSELVITKKVDKIQIYDLSVENFVIEVGGMDYGFDINGIIGMDFLLENRAVLDMDNLTIIKK